MIASVRVARDLKRPFRINFRAASYVVHAQQGTIGWRIRGYEILMIKGSANASESRSDMTIVLNRPRP